ARFARRRPVVVQGGTVVVLAALLRSPELALDPLDELLDAAVRLGVALVRDEPLVLARAVEDRLALPRLVFALEHQLAPLLPAPLAAPGTVPRGTPLRAAAAWGWGGAPRCPTVGKFGVRPPPPRGSFPGRFPRVRPATGTALPAGASPARAGGPSPRASSGSP